MHTDERGLENSGCLPDRESDVGFRRARRHWKFILKKEGARWGMTKGPISFFLFTSSAAMYVCSRDKQRVGRQSLISSGPFFLLPRSFHPLDPFAARSVG